MFLSFCRTKRAWRPNIQKKRYYSHILGTTLQLRMTCAAMRCIDKAGGFDSYIYHTPDKKLGSRLGSALKQRMIAIVKKYPNINPPPLVKRYPRPPRSLQMGAVSDTGTGSIVSSTNTRTAAPAILHSKGPVETAVWHSCWIHYNIHCCSCDVMHSTLSSEQILQPWFLKVMF